MTRIILTITQTALSVLARGHAAGGIRTAVGESPNARFDAEEDLRCRLASHHPAGSGTRAAGFAVLLFGARGYDAVWVVI